MIFMTIVISHVAELKIPGKKKMWKEIQKLMVNVEENKEAIDNGLMEEEMEAQVDTLNAVITSNTQDISTLDVSTY